MRAMDSQVDRPKKLILDDGSTMRQAGSDVLVGVGILLFAGVVIVMTAGDQLKDAEPSDFLGVAAIAGFWLVWVAFHYFVTTIHKVNTKRAINHLFENEIWQRWQFDAGDWQSIVEKEYQEMCPEEGMGAYSGAIASGIVGLVLSAIILALAEFVIDVDDDQFKSIMRIVAVAVFLLLVGVGLYQPVQQRRNARRYRKNASRVPAPRVWFGAEGIYHEAFGYTSLKDLHKVTDHAQKSHTIVFNVWVTTVFGSSGHSSSSTDSVPAEFRVPSGYEDHAGKLVRRYRQERLSD